MGDLVGKSHVGVLFSLPEVSHPRHEQLHPKGPWACLLGAPNPTWGLTAATMQALAEASCSGFRLSTSLASDHVPTTRSDW